MNHVGAAVVFENYAEMLARIEDPDLQVTAGIRIGSEELRTTRRAGHAGVGIDSDSGQIATSWGDGHGPH